jgi:hypothetical protein
MSLSDHFPSLLSVKFLNCSIEKHERCIFNMLWRIWPLLGNGRKHVPESHGVDKNRRPLLDNEFGYHGIIYVHVTTCTWKTGWNHFRRWFLYGSREVIKGGQTRPGRRIRDQRIGQPATVEEKTHVVQEETERALGSHRLWAVISDCIKCDCNSSANKSNHPIPNPLLLVTEPEIRHNTCMLLFEGFFSVRPYVSSGSQSYTNSGVSFIA